MAEKIEINLDKISSNVKNEFSSKPVNNVNYIKN